MTRAHCLVLPLALVVLGCRPGSQGGGMAADTAHVLTAQDTALLTQKPIPIPVEPPPWATISDPAVGMTLDQAPPAPPTAGALEPGRPLKAPEEPRRPTP